jgi:hypothetical protein
MLNLLKWSVFITEYLAFLVALFTWKRHTLVFRLFFFDLLLVFINETAGLYFIYFVYKPHAGNNLWTNFIYIVVEVWLMGMAGYLLISNKLLRKTIPWLLVSFTGMVVAYACIRSVHEAPVMCFFFASLILVGIFLYVIIQMVNMKVVSREPLFWMSIGLIIFYGCNIPYWGVFNYLLKNDLKMLQKLVMLLWVINILRYSLTTVSFLLLPKKTTTKVLPA